MKTAMISIGAATTLSLGMLVWAGPMAGSGATELDYRGTLELDGAPVHGTRDFRFSIYDADTGGNCLWQDERLAVQVIQGRFMVPLAVDDAALAAASDTHLVVEVRDPLAGIYVQLMGRQRLGAVPYALRNAPGKKFVVDASLSVGPATPPNTSVPAVLHGRGAFVLAAEAACLASGAADRFVTWTPVSTGTCAAACAAVTGCGTASCVMGWTLFGSEAHYRYGSECSTADTSGGQGHVGKLCCCTGKGCATEMFR